MTIEKWEAKRPRSRLSALRDTSESWLEDEVERA
jgi:hypothetical protein